MEIPEIDFTVNFEPVNSKMKDGLRKGYIAWGSIIVKIEKVVDAAFPEPPNARENTESE